MTTETEITTLAREYAEEVYKNAHKEMEVLPNCLSNEAVNMFAEDMKNKLKWLTRRFCLVEKDRVKDEYKKAKIDMVSKYHQGSMVVLQVLFPEIAKEVE